MDVKMPAGDGFSVQERLELLGRFDTPIIYITGDTSPGVEATSREVGAYALFHKPLDMPELLATVHRALSETCQERTK